MNTTMTKKNAEYQARFMQDAMNYSSKLAFVTRDEYLNWVKQWKEDYKLVLKAYVLDKLIVHQSACILPDKIARIQAKIDAIPALTAEETARLNELKTKFMVEHNRDVKWMKWLSLYELIQHMYVARKAGKIRANAQRNLRLVEQSKAV